MGCGSGREAILLATRGWEAGCEILIDFAAMISGC